MPTNRFSNLPDGVINATGRRITQELLEPAFTATLALAVGKAQRTYLLPGQLSGAMTINATPDALAQVGDELIMAFSADGMARTVTFGDLLAAPALALLANEFGGVTFIFDGTLYRGVSLNQSVV